MSRVVGFGGWHLGVAMATVAVVVGLAASPSAAAAGAAEPCCFANDRYQGVCTVVPGDGETCTTVLDYLNNPMSTGRTYCGGTKVRGGWVAVDCSVGKSASQQGVTASTPRGQGPAAPAGADGPKS
jgi:hypothetical protein